MINKKTQSKHNNVNIENNTPQDNILLKDMEWIKPLYSKKQVKKAGKVLINENASEIAIEEASIIINNWRSSHAFPLNSIQNSLRHRAGQITPDYLIGQRLKRMPSIKNKLTRFPEMSLERMQDLGGCRAIFPNINNVYLLKDNILQDNGFNIIREYDYINKPKSSGYRGIHLISKYNGKRCEFEDLMIEIQIRSQSQHYWATAVEIIGICTGQELKAGFGSPEWLEFFSQMSLAMNRLETNQQLDKTNVEAIKNFEIALNIKEKMVTFRTFINLTEELKKKRGWFLLILESRERVTNIKHFKQLAEGAEEYSLLEKNNLDDNIVLINAKSINELKKCYPNYFLDSEQFIEYLNKIIN